MGLAQKLSCITVCLNQSFLRSNSNCITFIQTWTRFWNCEGYLRSDEKIKLIEYTEISYIHTLKNFVTAEFRATLWLFWTVFWQLGVVERQVTSCASFWPPKISKSYFNGHFFILSFVQLSVNFCRWLYSNHGPLV